MDRCLLDPDAVRVIPERPYCRYPASGGASPLKQPGHFQVTKVIPFLPPSLRSPYLSFPYPFPPFFPFFPLEASGPLKSS